MFWPGRRRHRSGRHGGPSPFPIILGGLSPTKCVRRSERSFCPTAGNSWGAPAEAGSRRFPIRLSYGRMRAGRLGFCGATSSSGRGLPAREVLESGPQKDAILRIEDTAELQFRLYSESQRKKIGKTAQTHREPVAPAFFMMFSVLPPVGEVGEIPPTDLRVSACVEGCSLEKGSHAGVWPAAQASDQAANRE